MTRNTLELSVQERQGDKIVTEKKKEDTQVIKTRQTSNRIVDARLNLFSGYKRGEEAAGSLVI
jgi:hypothetical protein